MSLNFRTAQLLDAFQFSNTNDAIEQLRSNFTNVRTGAGAPSINTTAPNQDKEGNIYFDTDNHNTYIFDNSRWRRVSTGGTENIQQLLATLPVEQAN